MSNHLDGALQDAVALHRSVPTVDLHADTPLLMRRGYDFLKRHQPFVKQGHLFGHVDLPRMDECGMTAQVFGLVTIPYLQRGLMAEAVKQVDCVEDAVRRSGGALRLVAQAEELVAAHRDGVKASILSLEGIHTVDHSRDRPGFLQVTDALLALCERGVRSVGLVHFSRNSAVSPSIGKGADGHGLTELGWRVLEALQSYGSLIDLAHISRSGFLQVTAHTRVPVLVSHTGLKAFNPINRNIDDEQVKAVAGTGGVIGIMYSRQFLGGDTLERVVAEIQHLHDVGGEDVLALGSDFDGAVVPPHGLADVTGVPRLTQALLQVFPERTVKKFLGENVLRVLAAVPLQVGRWAAPKGATLSGGVR